MSFFRRAGALIARFFTSAADPAAAAGELKLYTKVDGSGVVQLFARASDGAVNQLTPVAPSLPPYQAVEFLEEFLNEDGWTGATDAGTGAATLTMLSGTKFVGTLQMETNAIGDGASVNLATSGGANFAKFLTTGFGVLTIEWLAMVDDIPAGDGTNDFTTRLTSGNTIPSGAGNGTCLGFSSGVAENGNANWWGILSVASKVDTGIAMDTDPHRFTVVYTPGVGVEWFIDGVSVATILGVPPIDGQDAFIGANIKNISAGVPFLFIDYIYFKYDITRP